ncbi:AAA family ATPase [Methylobacterium persicinum]
MVEGSAGSGKSFAMASVADAVRVCGGEVWVIAPSWKAVDVVRTDTATPEAMARAVTGFLNRVRKGEIALGPRTTVIADEAGMIGTRDLAALVEATGAAGAKLVLSGDTRQLAPVAAGAPMRLLVRALGASRMDEIQRQRGRSEAEEPGCGRRASTSPRAGPRARWKPMTAAARSPGGGPRGHDPGAGRRLHGQPPRSRRGAAVTGGADRLEQGRARAQHPDPRPAQARRAATCSGAQSNCGGGAIEGVFRRTIGETGDGLRRTFRETGRTIGETDARSSEPTHAA